ncbi:testis-expressed protein 264-like [Antedon mediterranea]|uniref:testis-expressed protein 264-like n=1 Tax=Antedon mediterranea TaxID=105859 RepID=UPI003AF962D2
MSTAILWGIAILFLLLCLTIISLLFYSGLLYPIEFKAGKPPVGSLQIAYKFGRGQYSDVGEYFGEVGKLVPSAYRSFGMYYDDPEKVPSGKQRYAVGTILSEGDAEPDKELMEKLESNGYKFHNIPEVTNMVHTTFPNKSFLSIIIGMQRVYPAFGTYIEETGLSAHPCFEIYDNDLIYFMAPLAKQSEFYVPEAKEKQQDPETESLSLDGSLDEDNSGVDGSGSSSGEDSGSSFEELDASQVTEEEDEEVEEEVKDEGSV